MEAEYSEPVDLWGVPLVGAPSSRVRDSRQRMAHEVWLERQDRADALLAQDVAAVVAVDARIAALHAERAVLVDRARQRFERSAETIVTGHSDLSPGRRAGLARLALVTELATALRLSEQATEALVAESEVLVSRLPGTMHALRGGRTSYRHAQIVVDEAVSLREPVPAEESAEEAVERKERDAEVFEAFEEAVLPDAARLNPARFRQRARRVRERVNPASIRERRVRAARDRCVVFEGARDGMAWMHLYAEASVVSAVYGRVSDTAIAMQGPEEERTVSQLRADVLCDVLLNDDTDAEAGGESSSPHSPEGAREVWGRVRPTVSVTVPVLTLMGLSEEPATLEGYGPIDADTARTLCAEAPSFSRILTHPETGAVLSVGRASYSVPAVLKRALRVRDGTCRFPGCGRAAVRCDLDHTVDWRYGGETAIGNLAHLCPKHHLLKHATTWRVTQQRGGSLRWRSPAGREHVTEPQLPVNRHAP